MAVEEGEELSVMATTSAEGLPTTEGLPKDISPLTSGIYSLLLPTNEEDIQQTLKELECYLDTGSIQAKPTPVTQLTAMDAGNMFPRDMAATKQKNSDCLYATATSRYPPQYVPQATQYSPQYGPQRTNQITELKGNHNQNGEWGLNASKSLSQLGFLHTTNMDNCYTSRCYSNNNTPNDILVGFKQDLSYPSTNDSFKPDEPVMDNRISGVAEYIANTRPRTINRSEPVTGNLDSSYVEGQTEAKFMFNRTDDNVGFQQWRQQSAVGVDLVSCTPSYTANPHDSFTQYNYAVSQFNRNSSVNSGLKQDPNQAFGTNQGTFSRGSSFEELKQEPNQAFGTNQGAFSRGSSFEELKQEPNQAFGTNQGTFSRGSSFEKPNVSVNSGLKQEQSQAFGTNQLPFSRGSSFEESIGAPSPDSVYSKRFEKPDLFDLDSATNAPGPQLVKTQGETTDSCFMDYEHQSLKSPPEMLNAFNEQTQESFEFGDRRGSDLSESSFASPDSSRSSNSDSENETTKLKDKSSPEHADKSQNPTGDNDLFRCNYLNCTQQYSKTSHCGTYKRMHGGEKPFYCPWRNCGWRFRRSDELKRHYRRHTGEKPYACPLCGRAFSRSDHRASHMRKLHPNSLTAVTG